MKAIHEIDGDEIEIRLISEADLHSNEEILKKLFLENFRINFPDLELSSCISDDGYINMLRFQKDGSAILIGAFIGMNIIGFLWAYSREFLGEKRLHIAHVIISDVNRSMGIGGKLLNSLEKIAKEMNIKKIELITSNANKEAIKFYQKNNFDVTRVQLEKELV